MERLYGEGKIVEALTSAVSVQTHSDDFEAVLQEDMLPEDGVP